MRFQKNMQARRLYLKSGSAHRPLALPDIGRRLSGDLCFRALILTSAVTGLGTVPNGCFLVQSGWNRTGIYGASASEYRSLSSCAPDRAPALHVSAKPRRNRASALGRPRTLKPIPAYVARGYGRRSRVRAAVEHVFARQKDPIALVVGTIARRREWSSGATHSIFVTSAATDVLPTAIGIEPLCRST